MHCGVAVNAVLSMHEGQCPLGCPQRCVQSGAVYGAASREVQGTDGTWMRPASEHGADVHTSHVLPGRLAWRASRPRLAPRRILSPSVSQDDLLTQSRWPPRATPGMLVRETENHVTQLHERQQCMTIGSTHHHQTILFVSPVCTTC